MKKDMKDFVVILWAILIVLDIIAICLHVPANWVAELSAHILIFIYALKDATR